MPFRDGPVSADRARTRPGGPLPPSHKVLQNTVHSRKSLISQENTSFIANMIYVIVAWAQRCILSRKTQ